MSTPLVRNVLPANPNPLHYGLHLVPDFVAFTFAGTVTIELEVTSPVSVIQLNAKNLTQITVAGADVAYDKTNERISITLPAPLGVGKSTLIIGYVGAMNDAMKGFYRSKYTTVDGETRHMGTTQFEPTDARQALPCWDEPARKASFQVSMDVATHLLALSNTSEISSVTLPSSGLKRVLFAPTPIMSTYLLAWTIGEMDWIGAVIPKSRGGSTLLRVFTMKGQSERGRFALELASKILPLYEAFFGSDYPLEKADQLAIPDFSAGAMENWGLITYRETALLCDPQSSASAKQRIALVVAHELSHQWFGNLVTMEWWKELWLNEAFATWVEYLAIDRIFPEWHVWTQFINDETGRALDLDSLLSSHPIEVDIVNASEVDEIFDAISYSKGGAVINMIVAYLGVDVLTSALAKYLNHFKYRNASTVDLWGFLEKESGKPVTAIMSTWTHRQGYPVLDVGGLEEDGTVNLSVTQRRFLASGPAPAEEDTVVWSVPITINNQSIILSQRTENLSVEGKAAALVVNCGQTAVCRVHYSPALFHAILGTFPGARSAADRLGIVRDVSALAESGTQLTSELLALLSAVGTSEMDYTVWCAVAAAEGSVKALLRTDLELRRRYMSWAATVYRAAAQRLGWTQRPTDDHRELQLRGLVQRRLVASGDAEAITQARMQFQMFLKDPSSVAGDVRLAIFVAEVSAGPGGWEAVRKVYETATDAVEKTRCLSAMGMPSDVPTLEIALAYALSDKVRSQDTIFLIDAIAANPLGTDLVFHLLQTKFNDLFTKFTGGFLMTRILKSLSHFVTEEKAVAVEAWWATVPAEQRQVAERSVKQAVEGIRTAAGWSKRSLDDIKAFLSE